MTGMTVFRLSAPAVLNGHIGIPPCLVDEFVTSGSGHLSCGTPR